MADVSDLNLHLLTDIRVSVCCSSELLEGHRWSRLDTVTPLVVLDTEPAVMCRGTSRKK
ncbi:Hypothetical predicted protein [Scomber scombrus]|uniref:Uncharacterized protein n=1 Tax=Scomber scombrus TaxID=13677 RepID=A0AAV1N0X4_SCOSC